MTIDQEEAQTVQLASCCRSTAYRLLPLPWHIQLDFKHQLTLCNMHQGEKQSCMKCCMPVGLWCAVRVVVLGLTCADLLQLAQDLRPSLSPGNGGHMRSPAKPPVLLQPCKPCLPATAQQHGQSSDVQKPAVLTMTHKAGAMPSAPAPGSPTADAGVHPRQASNDMRATADADRRPGQARNAMSPTADAGTRLGQAGGDMSETLGQVQQLLAAARDNPALAGLVQSAAEQHGLSMASIVSITQQLPQQPPPPPVASQMVRARLLICGPTIPAE